MSNATALRHAAVVARLIAGPHNAPIEIAEIAADRVIEFARVSKMGYAKVSDKTIERLLTETLADINAALDQDDREQQAKADVIARTSDDDVNELVELLAPITPDDVQAAAEADAKRSNFKHDACTHERTPKARAACRKARAKLA